MGRMGPPIRSGRAPEILRFRPGGPEKSERRERGAVHRRPDHRRE